MKDGARTFLLLGWGAAVLAILALNIVVPVPSLEGGWPWVAGLMAYPVAAVVVLARSRGNVIGHLLGLIGTVAGLQFALAWISGRAGDAPWAGYADAVGVTMAVGIFGGILGIVHLFPGGRALNRGHRRFLMALVVWMGLIAALSLVAPGPLDSTDRSNPLGIAPAWVATLVDGAIVTLPLAALVGVIVLAVRYRHAGPLERAQLRWFFAGASVLLAMFLMFAFLSEDQPGWREHILSVLFLLGFWSLPAAIVVAITRYHLYDIDRVLSRTVSYVVVAGVLTGLYAASVLALQAVLPVGGSQIAVAASTLTAAAAFQPVRTFVQQRIERRFNRSRYQARVVAEQFVRRLQREFDAEVIGQELSRVIAETLAPSRVQVWLRP